MKNKFKFGLSILTLATVALTYPASASPPRPWMDTTLSPDVRAQKLEAQMSEAQKLSLLHGRFGLASYYAGLFGFPAPPKPAGSVGSEGFVAGIPSLGIPALQETDGSVGVADMLDSVDGQGETALPSSLALASTFNPALAYRAGAMDGNEAWHGGFNVLLGPGMNLARDPRDGRNFEYLGEDPLLVGTMAAQVIKGIEAQHVVSTVKHFALNDQETNRMFNNAVIDDAGMRESDLLAFELAIKQGHPGAVMCAFNQINGIYSCGNKSLLNGVLKGDWNYPGWVMSDWGAVHSAKDALAGLDQESGEETDTQVFFGQPLADAVQNGEVPQARIDDMVHRILRSMFANGLFDHPPVKTPIDFAADGAIAQQEAEHGIVLLKNSGNILPLASKTARIAVIGGQANIGVLSGGGSAQVIPTGRPPAGLPETLTGYGVLGAIQSAIYDPDPPLDALKKELPKADISYDTGTYISSAVHLAQQADVVVIFATKWETESLDTPDLTLPNGQDALIDAVAKANPHVIVVLETGDPVVMPWLNHVDAVLETWYPGQRGGQAIANVLTGKADPSGHLPVTFPSSTEQLPRSEITGGDAAPGQVTTTNYNVEGDKVGYRWFAAKSLTPLFPFGYGLSYTSFTYAHLRLTGGATLTASFDVTNNGEVAGTAVPQLYLTSRAGHKLERLIGFSSVELAPGQTTHVSLTVNPLTLSDFNPNANNWRMDAGAYDVALARSAADIVANGEVQMDASTLAP